LKLNCGIEVVIEREIQTMISDLISEENGNVVASCEIKEIRFHAIRAELPLESIEKVINSEYNAIFSSDDVRFFRPVGQCRVEVSNERTEGDFEMGSASGEPVVAILDGMPFVNHTLLEDRLILDDPDDFGSAYLANERQHGTAMASLVCHGELDAQEEPLSRLVYFRPIMKPDSDDSFNTPKSEIIPKDHFMEDLILRSVRRVFEGDSGEDAVAPTIKVINISIGDPSKMFFYELSSCAKLLDWLSYKYQVLFCVSAGNITSDINFAKSISDVNSLSDDELLNLTMKKVHEDRRNRKMLSPAESINSITLGSIHADMSTIDNVGNRVDILPDPHLPSPISAHGLGYRNSIKPELYISGGRQLFHAINEKEYRVSDSNLPPGQRTAASPISAGERNRCIHIVGTSNSAALASRAAAQIYEMLNSLMVENNTIDDNNIAVILKALLVHGASWGNSYSILDNILRTSDKSGNFKRTVARYIGYGVPDFQRVLGCTSQRATAIGYGKIKDDDKHDFRFPLPPSLSGVNEMRRLTITLAWFSPINAANRKYRKANLSFEPSIDSIGKTTRVDSDWQQVKNGTVHHEVFEGNSVVTYQDGEFLTVSVVCRSDAGSLDEEVYYGIAVTLETAEGIELPIYEEIKERINIPISVEEQIE